jgi:hypothetical protein
MAEKRVSVRLAAVGGRQVRAELEGVGEAGARGFGRLGREMEAANARLAAFSRRVRVAAAAAVAAATAAGVAVIRSGLASVDAQAKLAQSLGTTVASIQTLERAGELAGVSMSGIEQATKDLTRRLSQAAADTGPAVAALDLLGLSAAGLLALPLDERVSAINAAIESFVPAAERAAVAGQLFGEEGSIAMSRIDTATLRQATEDVMAFGVVFSEQDADRIERTNDALSRLGLIWRGLSNQLAVAAAPALEAVADAMAALASRTGPLGIAIRGLFENIGRLGAYAATFAGIMAGRWVAGLVAAAVSVRGLATALVVLRGAILRTGIGALIVGAGELVYQFGRLVEGAGGFGNALALMGDVARAVWEAIGASASAFVDSFRAIGAEVQAIWLQVMKFLACQWADFLGSISPTVNRIAGVIGADFGIDAIGTAAWVSSFDGAILRAGRSAEGFRARAGATLTGAFDGVRASIDALSTAVARSGVESGEALGHAGAAVERVSDAFEGAETAARGAGGAARGAGTAAAEASTALKDAGTANAEAANAAATGWEAVTAALAEYATRARDIGGDVGQSLVGAFRSAETAVGDFVRSGKLDFRDLVTSMIADLAQLGARRFLLGPIATALSGALTGTFGGAFGGSSAVSASVLHGGGIVGADGPQRFVPAAAFLGAPRLHAGGWAGLAPDEVPAILQRGERVLSRREVREQGRASAGSGAAPSVNITIMTRDAESFRQSRTQVASDIARAAALGRRGL